MTIWRQALHVARKDLRFARRLLLALVALIALSAAGWLIGAEAIVSWSPLWGLATVLLAMFSAAFVVLEDSPAQHELLWTTLPLHPAAVLLAKLLAVGGAVVATALIAQALALSAFGLPATDMLRITLRSALLLAIPLAFAMLMGSLAKDRRVIALLLTLLPLALLIGGTSLWMAVPDDRMAHVADSVPWLLAAVLVTLLTALLAYHYITRHWRRTALLTTALFAAILLLPFLPLPLAGRDDGRTDGGLRVTAVEPDTGTSHVRVRLAMPFADSSLRYDFADLVVRLLHDDGRVDALRVRERSHVVALAASDATQYFETLMAGFGREFGTVSLTTTAAQRDALLGGRARAELTGRLLVRVPRTQLDVPIAQRTATAPGLRLAMTPRDDDGGTMLWLRIHAVGRAADLWRAPSFSPRPHQQFVLVHDARADTIAFAPTSSSMSGPPIVVVPGAGAFTGEVGLGRFPAGDPSAAHVTAEWLEQARLVVTHWVNHEVRPFRVIAGTVPVAVD